MKGLFRLFFIFWFLLLLASLAGCGRRTVPLVPPSPRPEAVRDIRAEARGATVFLSWPIPARNIEGKPMNRSDIVQFRVYRAVAGPDGAMNRYRLYTELNASVAVVRGNAVFWQDDRVSFGLTYGYRIRAVSARGGVSRYSDEVRVTPRVPLAVPQGLTATADDRSVRLTWKPVSVRLDGGPAGEFIGYNLYRSTEPGRYDEPPVNKDPLTKTTYRDGGLTNDHTYYYIVRSVDGPARPWNESPDSQEVSATPRDMTPPSRPTGLTVVAGVDRVFLTWNENADSDLAGYYVYRSTGRSNDFVRLTDTLLDRTTYSDESVSGGVTYSYVVTAVDRSGNESGRSTVKKARVEKLR